MGVGEKVGEGAGRICYKSLVNVTHLYSASSRSSIRKS